MERPVSVTVTCWVIIALAIEALFTIISGLAKTSAKEILNSISSPVPYSWIAVFSVVVSVLTIFISFLMLRGHNWARTTYLCLLFVGLIVPLGSFSQAPVSLLLFHLTKLLLFGTLLLRPQANDFFRRRRQDVVA